MATSCAIAKQRDDGRWFVSSVRSDGYLSGVGAILWKHYREPDRVDRLIDCGWVSPLEPLLEYHEKHKSPEDIEIYESREAVLSEYLGDYLYMFEDGDWWFHDFPETDSDGGFVPPRKITRDMLINDQDWPSDPVYLDDLTVPKPFWEETAETWQKLEAENTNPNVQYFSGNGSYGVSYSSPPLPTPLAPEDRDPHRYERFVKYVEAIMIERTELPGMTFGPIFREAQTYAIEQFGFANTDEASAFLVSPEKLLIDRTSVESLRGVPETAMVCMLPSWMDDLVVDNGGRDEKQI